MIGSLIVIGLLLLIVIVIYRLMNPKNSKLLRQFPGPPSCPILGILPTVFRMDIPEFSAWYWAMLSKHGSPTRYEFGPQIRLALFQADHVEILLKSSVNTTKGLNYDTLRDWLGKGLLLSEGAEWSKRRKQVTPAFHFQILKDFMPVFNEQSILLTEILNNCVDKENGPLNVCPYITNCTLDIICETAMGKHLGAQLKQTDYATSLERFVAIALDRLRNILLWPDFVFFNSAIGKESEGHLKVLHKFTEQVIEDRLKVRRTIPDSVATPQESDHDPFKPTSRRTALLDSLLDFQSSGQMTAKEVKEEVDTFMFGGHDTTATALQWAFYLIGAHPDIQERLFQEISEQLDLDSGNHVTSEDLAKLKYLDCVLKEIQRLYPSVPLIGRVTTQAFSIDNHTIPPGSTVNVSIYNLHRDPLQFPDPERFDPDRFLPENSEGRHPFAFLPFSAGPRNCIGQKFALLEMKIVLVHMLRKFKITSTQRLDETAPSIKAVLHPSNGIWLKLSRRE